MYVEILFIFFDMQVSDLSVPPCTNESDMVNADQFWSQIENEIIARGLCEGITYCYFQANCFFR